MKHSFQNSIWRHRDLRIVAPARALSFLGDEVALFALLLRLHDSGHGESGVALLFLVSAIPTIVAAPWAGRLVDRTDSRRLLAACGVLQALACLALAATSSLVAMLALVAALQTVQAAAGPGWQALVPSIVRQDDVARSFGVLQSLTFVAGVGGPALAGWLVATHGTSAALRLDAATFAVLTLAALAVRTRRGRERRPGAAEPGPFDGLRLLRADVVLWPLLIAMVVFVMAGESTNVVEVFLVRDVLGASPMVFGALGATFAVGAAAGALLGGRVRQIPQQVDVLLLAFLVTSLTMVAAGLVTQLVAWAVLWTLVGVAVGALQALCGALLAERAPAESRGQVFATAAASTRAASLVATALGGAVGTLAPRGSSWSPAAGALCATVLAGRSLRSAVRPPVAVGPIVEPVGHSA